MGVREVAKKVSSYLAVDVIDPAFLPAVNYPEENGLSPSEVVEIVRTLHETGKLKILDLTAYNPELDKSSISGKTVVNLISEILSS